jgi:hypothetical protein
MFLTKICRMSGTVKCKNGCQNGTFNLTNQLTAEWESRQGSSCIGCANVNNGFYQEMEQFTGSWDFFGYTYEGQCQSQGS